MRIARYALALCLALPAALPAPAPGQALASDFACPDLDRTVRRAMAGWQVPGLALGVVRGDRVLRAATYGVRDVGTGAPVTRRTLFAVGSVTKSLTALGLAAEAEAGGPSLDAPVRGILPDFPPGITLRHLLSHGAGWPRHDALWYVDAFGRAELTRRLARLPRFAAPGAAFQYNNVTYAAAGHAFETATGQRWGTWITRRLLRPAGMTNSVTTVHAFRSAEEHATGYFPADEGRIELPPRDTDPVAPAAGLYAPLDDMLRYVGLLSGEGIVDGRRVVPAAAVRALTAPAIDAGNRRYGLGLNLATWRGERLAFHPGAIDGYSARLSLLPDLGAGAIVLGNMSGRTPVAQIVAQTVLDCLTGGPARDWVARFGGRRPPPPPPAVLPPAEPLDRPVAAFAGTYAHPAYGALTLEPATDAPRLAGRFHGQSFRLDYAGGDRWRLTGTHWPLREGLIFAFAGLEKGRFRTLATPLADGPTYRHNAGPLVFSRTDLQTPADEPF